MREAAHGKDWRPTDDGGRPVAGILAPDILTPDILTPDMLALGILAGCARITLLQDRRLAACGGFALVKHLARQHSRIFEVESIGRIIIELDEHQTLVCGMAHVKGAR